MRKKFHILIPSLRPRVNNTNAAANITAQILDFRRLEPPLMEESHE
jgi:hypothetical protein